jgi:hypothetical protein
MKSEQAVLPNPCLGEEEEEEEEEDLRLCLQNVSSLQVIRLEFCTHFS